MALINCPECGKENVSDSAESCPNCGYGIKAHFEESKREEETKRLQQIRLNNIEMPKEPKKKMEVDEKVMIGMGIFLLLGTVLFFVDECYILGMFMMICGIGLIYIANIQFNNKYKKALSDYELAMDNFEKYQKQKLQEQDTESLRRINEMQQSPKCPNCGSYNIVHISSIDRMASVAMVGVASGKIGKQYKCKDCKHMW